CALAMRPMSTHSRPSPRSSARVDSSERGPATRNSLRGLCGGWDSRPPLTHLTCRAVVVAAAGSMAAARRERKTRGNPGKKDREKRRDTVLAARSGEERPGNIVSRGGGVERMQERERQQPPGRGPTSRHPGSKILRQADAEPTPDDRGRNGDRKRGWPQSGLRHGE